jgi:ABC-type Co2+ transport system permease subunit
MNASTSLSLLLVAALKWFVEGLAVAIAMVLVSRKSTPNVSEVLAVASTAALVFAVLDTLAPSVAESSRHGAGFGLGANLVGFPQMR